MTTRPHDDFLGWAPAEPVEWAQEVSGDTPLWPRPGPAPESAPLLADAARLAPASSNPAPLRPARQPLRAEAARTSRAPQQTSTPTPAPRQRTPPSRQRQLAGPLFRVTAIAAGILALFTIAMVISALSGERALGSVPIFAGVATLALVRAAVGMRPR